MPRRAGLRNIANLIRGFDAWKAAGLPFAVPGSVAAGDHVRVARRLDQVVNNQASLRQRCLPSTAT